MSTLLTRRGFLTRTATFGAGLAAASAFPTLARAAIPPAIYTIQQKSTGRFLDAWDDGSHDWFAVTRPAQNNASQQWLVTYDDSGTGTATVQQMSTGRYLDAHEIQSLDFHVLTRPKQGFDQTQNWHIDSIGGGYYTLQQASNNRLLYGYGDQGHDWGVVTRLGRAEAAEQWTLTFVRYA